MSEVPPQVTEGVPNQSAPLHRTRRGGTLRPPVGRPNHSVPLPYGGRGSSDESVVTDDNERRPNEPDIFNETRRGGPPRPPAGETDRFLRRVRLPLTRELSEQMRGLRER